MHTYETMYQLCFILLSIPVLYVSSFLMGRYKIDKIDAFQIGSMMNTEEKIKNVKFFLFTRKNIEDHIEMVIGDDTTYDNFDPNKVTHFIIHGWLCPYRWMLGVKDAILENRDYNVVVVSWPSINPNYLVAKTDTAIVGTRVAELIDELSEKKSLNHSRVHVLGHSLGGQTAGVVGNRVKKGKLGKVTGLDPASVLFAGEFTAPEDKLSSGDADCVQVIHTNNLLGLEEKCGDTDFYPNGGKKQIGCTTMEDQVGGCSHMMAVVLYEFWIKNNTYIGVECDSWENYKKGLCSKNQVAKMGEEVGGPCPQGKFFLKISGTEPFKQLKIKIKS